jgi:hypothetical protein
MCSPRKKRRDAILFQFIASNGVMGYPGMAGAAGEFTKQPMTTNGGPFLVACTIGQPGFVI